MSVKDIAYHKEASKVGIKIQLIEVMKSWGCPAHVETLAGFLNDDRKNKDLKPYSIEYVRTNLLQLAEEGTIRKVRPAVYSAFGPERD